MDLGHLLTPSFVIHPHVSSKANPGFFPPFFSALLYGNENWTIEARKQ
jgi:hypothetical protein